MMPKSMVTRCGHTGKLQVYENGRSPISRLRMNPHPILSKGLHHSLCLAREACNNRPNACLEPADLRGYRSRRPARRLRQPRTDGDNSGAASLQTRKTGTPVPTRVAFVAPAE